METITQNIASDLQMIKAFISAGYHYGPIENRNEEYFRNEAVLWLDGKQQPFSSHYSDDMRCKMALVHLLLWLARYNSNPLALVMAERERQNAKGYTISRDRVQYKTDELKRFALHRLTGNDRFYPFTDPQWMNSYVNHNMAENVKQAAALLLAHLQKEEAKRQFMELSAQQSESNDQDQKEVA